MSKTFASNSNLSEIVISGFAKCSECPSIVLHLFYVAWRIWATSGPTSASRRDANESADNLRQPESSVVKHCHPERPSNEKFENTTIAARTLEDISLYNEDLDIVPELSSIARLRADVAASDGVVIATPNTTVAYPAF